MTESGESPAAPTDSSAEEIARLRAENDQLRAGLEKRVGWRRVLAVILVVLTSVSLVSAVLAVWAHQVVFDTDRFMATVEPALDNPELYVLVGDRASESVLGALDIETRLSDALADLDTYLSDALADALDISDQARELLQRFDRPSLEELAPPIAAALERRIDTRIHQFFSSEAFTSRFPELVRRVHAAAVALARDELSELPNVYVEDGEVRLNLIPYIGAALSAIADEIRAVLPDFELPTAISDRLAEGRDQLAAALQTRLPEDFAQVTVMSEEALSEVQTIAVQLDRYVWLAVLVTIALLAGAIAVSPNRRRTSFHLGIGVFVAVVIVTVILRRLQAAIVEQILDPRGADVAREMVSDVFSGLRTLQIVLAVAAILIAIVAYLAGRPAWFARLTATTGEWTSPAPGGSRLDRWVAGHSGVLQVVGVLLAVVVFFFVGLDLISIIVIGLLLGGYLWAVAAASRRGASDVIAEEPVAATTGTSD